MPGMSPRIKAKKGRFGVDGLVPTIRITSPANGFTIADGNQPFTLSGEAFDDAGEVSSSIVWSSDIDSGLGTGKYLSVTLSAVGSPAVHVITASITVGGDTSTDTITVTVTP